MQYQILIEEDGRFSLPPAIQEALAIQAGDMLVLESEGDRLFISLKKPIVADVSYKMTQLMQEAGISLAEVLAGSSEAREATFQKYYGDPHNVR